MAFQIVPKPAAKAGARFKEGYTRVASAAVRVLLLMGGSTIANLIRTQAIGRIPMPGRADHPAIYHGIDFVATWFLTAPAVGLIPGSPGALLADGMRFNSTVASIRAIVPQDMPNAKTFIGVDEFVRSPEEEYIEEAAEEVYEEMAEEESGGQGRMQQPGRGGRTVGRMQRPGTYGVGKMRRVVA